MVTQTRESPHVYLDDPETPGTCKHCHRADPGALNQAHRLPDVPEQAEHRRRVGDQEGDA